MKSLCQSIGLFVLFGSVSLPQAEARCMNWCSKNGICTEAGDAGYCICNRGFYSADCSKQFCPKAYDPLVVTDDSPRRSIILTVGLEDDVPGMVGGELAFEFNKDIVKFTPLSSSAQCSAFIEKLPGVRKANCVRETESYPVSFRIEFTAFSLNTIESNVYTHDGNPSLGDFFCDSGHMMGHNSLLEDVGVYCTVTDLNDDGLPAYEECSHHGECNARLGKCSCDRGFYGPACDDTTDTGDHHVFEHDGPYFTGTVLKSVAYRLPSDQFNVFVAGVSQTETHDLQAYTTVRGDGTLLHEGGDVIVNNGGVRVESSDASATSLLDLSLSTDAGTAANLWADRNATLIKGSTFLPGQFHMQLFNTEMPLDMDKVLFLDPVGPFSVLNITAQGDLSTSGNLCAANRTLVVEDGMVIAESLNVVTSLDVHGSANIEDSLTIGSGFALTPEGMTIDSSTHSGPLLELRSMKENFDGALLEINTVRGSSPAPSALIRATVDDVITFDVSTAGDMRLRGLRMHSGGIEVEAGGVQVKSGGLEVQGGFTLLSGDLTLPDNNFKAKTFGAENDNLAQSLLSLTSTSVDYAGSAIVVQLAAEKSSRFKVLEAKSAGKDIVSIDGTGAIAAAGGVSVGGGLVVEGPSLLKGGVSFDKSTVTAGDKISILASSSVYTEIMSDGKASLNAVTFERGEFNGQVAVVTNSDEDVTTGDAVVHPGSTLMFVFNNGQWRALEALPSHVEEIVNVRKLEVANDVFIGNHTLTAGGLKLLSLSRGDVLVGGLDGLVRARQGFSFMNGVLSTPSLQAKTLGGALDAQFNVISDVVLENAQLKDATVDAKDVRMPHLTGVAYFDESGHLRGASDVQVDEAGKLHLSDVWDNLDFHSAALNNVGTIRASILKDVKTAEIDKLIFPTSAVDAKSGSLAFLRDDNSLGFSSAASVDVDGLLTVTSLGAHEQRGAVDFNGNKLLDAAIVGGTAENLSEVSATKITLLSTVSAEGSGNRLAVLTPEGVLQRDDASSVGSHITALSVQALAVSESLTIPALERNERVEVEVLGAEQGTGRVVKSGVTVRDSTVVAAHIDAGLLSVQKLSLKQGADGARAGVLVADASGLITVEAALHVSSVKSESLSVTGAASVEALSVSSLSSGGRAAALVVVDSTGALRAPADLSVELSSLAATEEISTPTLKIPGQAVGGVLAVMDASGRVAGTASLSVEHVSASKSVSVEGLLSASNIKLSGIQGSAGSVVAVDAEGMLSIASSVAADDVTAGSVLAKRVTAASLHLLDMPAGSLLETNSEGVVGKATKVSVESVAAVTVAVAGEASVRSLSVSSVQGASLLGADASGRLVPVIDATVSSLTVTNGASVGSLVVSALDLPQLEAGVMSVDSKGTVSSTSAVAVKSVSTDELLVAKEASLGSLLLKNAPSGVLTSDASGAVTASPAVSVDSVSCAGTITTAGLSVGDVTFTGGLTDSLVAVDANGKLTAATSKHLAHLASETITSQRGSFAALHFTQTASSSATGSDGKTRLMTVDAAGAVNTDSTIELLHMSADTLAVEMADVKSLLLSSLKEGALLYSGPKGLVQSTDDIILTSVRAASVDGDVVVAKTLKVSSLASEGGSDLVVAGSDGSLRTASGVSVKAISAESLTVTGAAVVGSLTAESVTLKNTQAGSQAVSSVLGVDASSGKMHASSDLSISSVTATTATVLGVLSAADFKLTASPKGLLSVTADGTLKVSSDSSVESLTAKVLVTEALTIKPTGSGAGGVLVASQSGAVSSSQSLQVKDLQVSQSVKVLGTVSAAALSAASLAVGGASSLLAADSTGTIVTTSAVTVDSIASSTIVATSSASLQSLQVPSLKSTSVLATTPDGTVTAASSITGMDKVQAQVMSGGDMTATQSLTMPAITSAALLGTDATGRVVSRTELTLVSLAVGSVTSSSLVSGRVQIKDLAAGVVSAGTDGTLVSSRDLTLEDVTAASVTASKTLKTAALTISSARSAALLATDSDGVVIATDKLAVSSVNTATLTATGLSAAGSLRVGDLASAKPAVLTADSTGQVVASSAVKVTSLDATDVTVTAALSTPALVMPGSPLGVLSVVNSRGGVESTSSVKLTDLTSDSLSVNTLAVVGDLQVKSLSTKSTAPELVAVDSTGKLTSLANLDAYLPNMKDAKFSSVEATGRVSAGSFHVSSGDLVDGMMLTVDSKGAVKPASSPTLAALTLTADLTVHGATHISKLSVADTASSLLVSNARNEVVSLPGSHLMKDGTLSLSSAKIDSLTGDVALNGNSVTNAKIMKGLIKESEFFLDAAAAKHGGNLAVRNVETGLLEFSDLVGVSSAGLLKTNGFVPLTSGATIAITKASISDSTLSDVVISDAASVHTKALTVKGPADFGDDVFIAKSLTVGGSVMASGPYVDSSDARFKKNVVPITNALDKVCHIGGAYYEYRTEEFPSRGFESGRQMGWIAQSVEAVAPELVREDSEGYKSVAYARSSALLAAAVKELKGAFEAEIAGLREELVRTQQEVKELKQKLESSYVKA